MSDTATKQYKFVFSTLLPQPKLFFQYDKEIATTYIRDSTTRDIQRPLHVENNQVIPLKLTKGVLNLQYCDQLLKDLLKMDRLKPFQQKVNPVRDNARDYDLIIKNPMDLKTLQDRLYTGLITDVNQFKQELDLIWNNCALYNGEGHELARLARQVQAIINEVWSDSRPPASSNALVQLQKLDGILSKLDVNLSKIIHLDPRPNITPVKKPKSAPRPQVQTPPPQPKQVELPPNRQQRKVIAEKLSATPVSELREAWDILKPHLTKEILERPYLSLDSLPDDALIALKKAVLG